MERNPQRINGDLMRLHQLTDDELDGVIAHTFVRVERAAGDLETLGQEAARRFAIAGGVGEAVMARVYQFPGQMELPGFSPEVA